MAAGAAVEFSFSGLPNTPTWPRTLAVGLAIAILLGGAFYSASGRKSNVSAERQRLENRREKLFSELTALEDSYRAGRVDAAHYTSQRQQLIASLERIYAALDEEAAA